MVRKLVMHSCHVDTKHLSYALMNKEENAVSVVEPC